MKEMTFIDTNILVYTDDADSPEKAEIAINFIEEAMRHKTGIISTQILQEYFVAVTRKLGIDAEIAKRRVEIFSLLHTVQITPQDVLSAINLHRLYPLSFWDSLVIHAAKISGCKTLLTEDLSHGQQIEGIHIINPFK